jgi:hypothetical protein
MASGPGPCASHGRRLTPFHAEIIGNALCKRPGTDGQCDPSHDTIAADVGCSSRTVRRALGGAEGVGAGAGDVAASQWRVADGSVLPSTDHREPALNLTAASQGCLGTQTTGPTRPLPYVCYTLFAGSGYSFCVDQSRTRGHRRGLPDHRGDDHSGYDLMGFLVADLGWLIRD